MNTKEAKTFIYCYNWVIENYSRETGMNQRAVVFQSENRLFVADWFKNLTDENDPELNNQLMQKYSTDTKIRQTLLDERLVNLSDLFAEVSKLSQDAISKVTKSEIYLDLSNTISNIEFLDLPGVTFKFYDFKDSLEPVGILNYQTV
ncbi:hypothetical protein [Companilactobacillus mishanensis]|uniref:Uncharacterized protein n=1 Tax=Companilactobacillus mishanensis TaxID=2486008 RepID=A0A5P0ZHP1_9LACO|nr:hypothetical protein [Companilactobacillus mishanensis]MQS52586.1 hypothetical protein [Companilactobacillus mishanensis]